MIIKDFFSQEAFASMEKAAMEYPEPTFSFICRHIQDLEDFTRPAFYQQFGMVEFAALALFECIAMRFDKDRKMYYERLAEVKGWSTEWEGQFEEWELYRDKDGYILAIAEDGSYKIYHE